MRTNKVNAMLVAGPLALAILIGGPTVGLAQTAGVQIIHNSPDPAAATVDIYLGTDLAVPDLGFREATPVVDLPAGTELQIGVAPGNSTSSADVLAWFPVTLDAGQSYAVMAAGVLGGGVSNPDGVPVGFDLEIYPGLQTTAGGGQVGLLAFHGAPDAPTVDVRALGVGTLFGSLTFREYDGYLPVPAGSYTLQVTPAGNASVVVAAFTADLSGLGGAAAVVFASGLLAGSGSDGFGLFAALPNGQVVELQQKVVAATEVSWGGVKGLFD